MTWLPWLVLAVSQVVALWLVVEARRRTRAYRAYRREIRRLVEAAQSAGIQSVADVGHPWWLAPCACGGVLMRDGADTTVSGTRHGVWRCQPLREVVG